MTTQNDLQKRLEANAKELAALSARRSQLLTDLDRLSQAIELQTKALADATLKGEDTTKQSEKLATDRARLEGISAALELAKQKITELETARDEAQMGIKRLEFNKITGDIERLLVICADRLRDLVTTAEKIEPLFFELQKMGAAAGVPNLDYDDYLRALRVVTPSVSEGLAAKLFQLSDPSAARVLEQARQGK
jgi:hypothetical protein